MLKIAIVGSGAMGCLYGYLLKRIDCQVTLIDTWEEHVKVIKEKGLTVMDGLERKTISMEAVTDASSLTEKMDLIILFVKAYDTKSAFAPCLHLIDQDTRVLTLQNGAGNIEAISCFVPKNKILSGTTAHGATMQDKGVVIHAGKGKTFIGCVEGENEEEVKEILAIFNKAGIETELKPNIEEIMWDKLLVNVGINGLTAILEIENGKLLEMEETQKLMGSLVAEAEEVARHENIKISHKLPLEHVKSVAKATGNNQSSMLQDLKRGRKTEIEYINGAIVRKGHSLGVPTPYNETVELLVKAKEKSWLLSDLDRTKELKREE